MCCESNVFWSYLPKFVADVGYSTMEGTFAFESYLTRCRYQNTTTLHDMKINNVVFRCDDVPLWFKRKDEKWITSTRVRRKDVEKSFTAGYIKSISRKDAKEYTQRRSKFQVLRYKLKENNSHQE